MKIDVIIPIYNAYEYLVSCVDSIYKNTSTDEFDLILINDCSPDERISKYLKTIKSEYLNLTVYENDKNLGFVGTVNKGMKNTSHDVILLNSDTEVTPKWIQKLVLAAYSKKEIATVTPLTNSGTICSVPNFCEDNEIPKTYEDYEAFGNMIDGIQVGIYPEAPTGVGFCMYIKRSVINEIGYFDEDRFGKGYGEENDFCCRCREHGYINIIDDCTFIYHKGSMSFESSKDLYIKNNLKVLSDLYPYYNQEVGLFCENNPLKDIHKCIQLKIDLDKNDKNILFVLHNDFEIGRNHPCGGTEMHVRDIVNHMRHKANCYVLSTHKTYIMLDIYYGEKFSTLQIPLKKAITLTDYYRTDYHDVVKAIFAFFHIGLVHIHHFKGNTFDIVDIAKQMNVPVFYTIHDYYSICPNINLLYDDQIYCKFINGKSTCNACVKKKHRYNEVIDTWRKHFYENLRMVDRIIAPSLSTRDILLSSFQSFGYDISTMDIKVIEHGEFEQKDIISVEKYDHQRLRIIVFGGIIKHKGSAMLSRLLEICEDYDWFIVGNIYDETIRNLQKRNVYLKGTYDKKDIFHILDEIQPDLTLTLPIWPETFSYVLSESYAAGIPVLGTNLGALKDRIIEHKTGWHVSFPLDIGEIVNKLKEIDENREQTVKLKKQLLQYKIKYVNVMNKEYEQLYFNHIIENHIKTTKTENKIIISGFYDASVLNENSLEYDNLLRKYSELETVCNRQLKEQEQLMAHIQEIHSSTTWKTLLYINTHLHGIKKLLSPCIRFMKKLFHR